MTGRHLARGIPLFSITISIEIFQDRSRKVENGQNTGSIRCGFRSRKNSIETVREKCTL
jgi:hypothetical protein